MDIGQKIVEVARSHAGTPWEHQGKLPGVGLDCVGFIVTVAQESGAVGDVEFEANYRRRSNGEQMLSLLADYLEPVAQAEDARPGDILALCDEALRFPDVPRHLIILTEIGPHWRGIHHPTEDGVVVEHRLNVMFKRRVHSIWRARRN
jgi:cell wall-associated NlpC family hydrolase